MPYFKPESCLLDNRDLHLDISIDLLVKILLIT